MSSERDIQADENNHFMVRVITAYAEKETEKKRNVLEIISDGIMVI